MLTPIERKCLMLLNAALIQFVRENWFVALDDVFSGGTSRDILVRLVVEDRPSWRVERWFVGASVSSEKRVDDRGGGPSLDPDMGRRSSREPGCSAVYRPVRLAVPGENQFMGSRSSGCGDLGLLCGLSDSWPRESAS